MDTPFKVKDLSTSLLLSSISQSILMISNLLASVKLSAQLSEVFMGYRALLHYAYTEILSKDSNE